MLQQLRLEPVKEGTYCPYSSYLTVKDGRYICIADNCPYNHQIKDGKVNICKTRGRIAEQ